MLAAGEHAQQRPKETDGVKRCYCCNKKGASLRCKGCPYFWYCDKVSWSIYIFQKSRFDDNNRTAESMPGTMGDTRNTARFSGTRICKACWRSTGMTAKRTSSSLCEWSRVGKRKTQSDKGAHLWWVMIRGGSPGGGTPRNCRAYRRRVFIGVDLGPIAADHAIGGNSVNAAKRASLSPNFCKSRTGVADWPIRVRQRVGDSRGDALVKRLLPNAHMLPPSHPRPPLGFLPACLIPVGTYV